MKAAKRGDDGQALAESSDSALTTLPATRLHGSVAEERFSGVGAHGNCNISGVCVTLEWQAERWMRRG
jgi:hypothetical protein